MRYFQDKLMANLKAGDLSTANIDKWEPSTWPKEPRASASPRRRAAPWATGSASRMAASTTTSAWCRPPGTAVPRDSKGQIGAFEASLMNTPVAKADQPLEILRTLHSFDPCLACSTHVMAPDGAELTKVRVR
jgi:hydrogenase large subunit